MLYLSCCFDFVIWLNKSWCLSSVRFIWFCFVEITNYDWTSVGGVLLIATSTPLILTVVIVFLLRPPNPGLKIFLFFCDCTCKAWFKFLVVATVLTVISISAAVYNWQYVLGVTDKSIKNEFRLDRESSDTLLMSINPEDTEFDNDESLLSQMTSILKLAIISYSTVSTTSIRPT